MKLSNKCLDAISKIYSAAEGNQFQESTLQQKREELQYLSDLFQVSQESACMFSIIYARSIEGQTVDYYSIGKHLKSNVIEVMARSEIFQELLNTQLINEKKINSRRGKSIAVEFFIPERVQTSIVNNQFPIRELEAEIKTPLEVIEIISEYQNQCIHEEIPSYRLFLLTNTLLDEHKHFPLVTKIKKKKLSDYDSAILFNVLWNTIMGTESTYLTRILEHFIRQPLKRLRITQEIIKGDNKLLKDDILEIEKASFFNDACLKLGKKGIKLLEEEGIKVSETDNKDLLDHQDICFKELFYNQDEKKNLELVSGALQLNRFKEIQEMLNSKTLPLGFNCIFYGPPGTGKTEGVLQIAKSTKRDVLKVDISETKSKWFGDSEKLIKKIFTKYDQLKASSENAPILLFNEADAILSRRTEISDSNTAQTINTMQNILLEELENFDGIFIATTNLINNLDPAFERRFLFKIQINRPGVEAREKIWKARLDFLNAEQQLELAQKFDFSGGEIENITRKIFMHEIINSEKIIFKEILEFCAQEKFENTGNRSGAEKKTIVGFQKKSNEGSNLAR